MSVHGCVATLIVLALTEPLLGQFPATVQLPVVQQFSSVTTVLVPDGGGLSLGGVSRSSGHRSQLGAPFRSRTSGGSAAAVSVHATIHDLGLLDAAVMEQWRQMQGAPPATSMTRCVDPIPTHRLPVRQARQQAQKEAAERLAKAKADLQAGIRWEQKGNHVLAQNYYERALRRVSVGNLRHQIEARLAAVAGQHGP